MSTELQVTEAKRTDIFHHQICVKVEAFYVWKKQVFIVFCFGISPELSRADLSNTVEYSFKSSPLNALSFSSVLGRYLMNVTNLGRNTLHQQSENTFRLLASE